MEYLVQPTKEQFDLIYGEFDTSRERVREDVQSLITWLAKQPHLPNITGKKLHSNLKLITELMPV